MTARQPQQNQSKNLRWSGSVNKNSETHRAMTPVRRKTFMVQYDLSGLSLRLTLIIPRMIMTAIKMISGLYFLLVKISRPFTGHSANQGKRYRVVDQNFKGYFPRIFGDQRRTA